MISKITRKFVLTNKNSFSLEIEDSTNLFHRKSDFEHYYNQKSPLLPGAFSITGSNIFKTRNQKSFLKSPTSSFQTNQKNKRQSRSIKHCYRNTKRQSNFRCRFRVNINSFSIQ